MFVDEVRVSIRYSAAVLLRRAQKVIEPALFQLLGHIREVSSFHRCYVYTVKILELDCL